MTRRVKLHIIKQQRRRLWQIAEVLCVVVFVCLVIRIGIRIARQQAVAREESAAREHYRTVSTEVQEPSSMPGAAVTISPYFQDLLAQNADTVGLLSFGPDMSLYVCQGDDNIYYRNHRFDGSEDPAGMIFLDFRNSIRPQSQNMILYGHNMKDGSRFGKLKRFEETEYLAENLLLNFSTLYESWDYLVFSVFHTTTDASDPEYFAYDIPEFASQEEFDAYVSAVKERSIHHNLPVDVQYGDSLLTLATCSSELDDGLLVIVCKAVVHT